MGCLFALFGGLFPGLAKLRDQGILSDEKFEAKQKQILGI